MAVVILSLVLAVIDRDGGFRPQQLEKALSSMDGSLLSYEDTQFGISGFTYGEDFPGTIKMLGLQRWFTKEHIDSI